MASLVASLPAATPSTPIAEAVQPKKYLDRCIEQLDPSALNKSENDAFWYDIAGKALLVGFIALSVGGFVAVGVYAPTFLAVTGIAIMLVAAQVDGFVKESFFQPSQVAASKAEALKEIQRHYQDLTRYAPENIKAVLQKMDIIWFLIPSMLQNPADLNTLKPLIASHQFWQGRIETLKQNRLKTLQKAQDLTSENFDQNRKEIKKLHKRVLELDKMVLISTVKDAFVLAAIRQPTLSKSLEEIGNFSTLTQQERVINNAIGYTTANTFFAFTNSTLAPLTVDEVKQTSTADLSVRLLAAAQ